MVEACDDFFINYFDESSWRRAAAFRHGKPLEEARGRAERREGSWLNDKELRASDYDSVGLQD